MEMILLLLTCMTAGLVAAALAGACYQSGNYPSAGALTFMSATFLITYANIVRRWK